MNSFKFYPVGQGLFYSGSLFGGNYNFVYDCGTESQQEYLNNAMELYIEELKRNAGEAVIEFVVISHLHKDHFSGLYSLAKQARIKKLYLPYLGNTPSLISLVLANAIYNTNAEETNSYNDELFHFMRMLYRIDEYTNNFPQIESIIIEKNDEDVSGELENDRVFFIRRKTITSPVGNEQWEFIFFNHSISLYKMKELEQKVKDELTKNKAHDIVQLIQSKNGISKIADIYKTVFQEEIKKDRNHLNLTSIILIHFPTNSKLTSQYYNGCEKINVKENLTKENYCESYFSSWLGACNYRDKASLASILTGDAMINEAIAELLRQQLNIHMSHENIMCGFLQIPHHGSKHNWKELKKSHIDAFVNVISFGLGNRHHHPHAQTINELIHDKKTVYLVNQIDDFKYCLK